jgi:hypothetical protein
LVGADNSKAGYIRIANPVMLHRRSDPESNFSTGVLSIYIEALQRSPKNVRA